MPRLAPLSATAVIAAHDRGSNETERLFIKNPGVSPYTPTRTLFHAAIRHSSTKKQGRGFVYPPIFLSRGISREMTRLDQQK